MPATPAARTPGTPPTRTVSDGPAIFKKAFWRDPSAADQIVNAERREWSDAEGVTRWQWFIEVNASPDLLKHLREDNPFGLRRTSATPLPEGLPPWFSYAPEEVEVLKSATGGLQMIFSKQNSRLLATSSGNGFQRGAPAPASTRSTVTRQEPVPGRLPTTPPPNPRP